MIAASKKVADGIAMGLHRFQPMETRHVNKLDTTILTMGILDVVLGPARYGEISPASTPRKPDPVGADG